MERLSTRMGQAKIAAESADQSVVVNWSKTTGFVAQLDPDTRDIHNEETLAKQVEYAWNRAVEAVSQAVEMIRAERRGGRSRNPSPQDTPVGKRKLQALELVEEVTTEAASPRNYVTAAWDGRNDVMVLIRSGAIRKLSHSTLTSEINDAMASVTRKHQSRIKQIHQKLFQQLP